MEAKLINDNTTYHDHMLDVILYIYHNQSGHSVIKYKNKRIQTYTRFLNTTNAKPVSNPSGSDAFLMSSFGLNKICDH